MIKVFSETNKKEAKEQKSGIIGMLLDVLGAILLGNLLTSKELKRPNKPGQGIMRAGKDTIRAGESQDSSHPLTNFEIRKYYQNEPKSNCV